MGSQTPSDRVVPEYEYTDGHDAVKILRAAGLIVDPWQDTVLCDWMGRDADGIWTAQTCGLSVPRQNGKTCNVTGRSASGMILYNEWVIYTAHLQKTATETYNEIKGLFESRALKKHVKEFKSAIGREQIILNNGGRIIFVARTRNGGRGLHGDCLIFDEAQELTEEQQASFLPAISASKNPQTIHLGTPPDEKCDGGAFRRLRGKALSGESESIAWTEFSVDEIGDVTDRRRWAETNPALGIRIRETTIASELENMSPDTFARERLGWWSPVVAVKIDYAIDHEKWETCMSKKEKPGAGKAAFGVKFTADGAEVILAGAVILQDGSCRTTVLGRENTADGIRWLSDWLNERYTKACCVVIDGRNGTDLLIDRIKTTWRAKGSVIKPAAKDVIAAASEITDAVNEGRLSWYFGQQDLDHSARTSVKRPICGGYGFGGENSAPLEACSLALWGAAHSKRNPERKQKIG